MQDLGQNRRVNIMKRSMMVSVWIALLVSGIFAQSQITRVSVIDLQKVYMTYYKDSQAVRAFEDEKSRVQTEIKRLGDEIKNLQKRQLDLRAQGFMADAASIDEILYRKAQFLADFIKIKQAELDAKAMELTKSDAFVQTLYRTVQSIAELEGYSLVLSSKNADEVGSSIIWFSPMIDITDKVIQMLLGAGR
jgi:outer membrane protein